tara:strand:+ start:5174 stop:5935 length:762 start_codon:yes stop_codon:yes gene_type:complete
MKIKFAKFESGTFKNYIEELDNSYNVTLLKEPYKFYDEDNDDNPRAWIVITHPDGKHYVNSMWIKPFLYHQNWTVKQIRYDQIEEVALYRAVEMFDGSGLAWDQFQDLPEDDGWGIGKRLSLSEWNSNNLIKWKSFKVHMNQAMRDGIVFHQDNKYAYAVYFTNPKKSNRPFVIKLVRDFGLWDTSLIGLPVGWKIVGNMGAKVLEKQSTDFKDDLMDVLSDDSIWESTESQFQTAVKPLQYPELNPIWYLED